MPIDRVKNAFLLDELILALIARVLSPECTLEYCITRQDDIKFQQLLLVVAPISSMPHANLGSGRELAKLIPPLHDGNGRGDDESMVLRGTLGNVIRHDQRDSLDGLAHAHLIC